MTPARVALVLPLLVLAQPTLARPTPYETVTVTRRVPYVICMGDCPNYTIAVHPDGRIVVKQGWVPIRRYRLQPVEAAIFADILHTYRPPRDPHRDPWCRHNDEDPRSRDLAVEGVKELEIHWSGPPSVHVIRCTNQSLPLLKSIRHALQSIKLFENGSPVEHGHLDDALKGQYLDSNGRATTPSGS